MVVWGRVAQSLGETTFISCVRVLPRTGTNPWAPELGISRSRFSMANGCSSFHHTNGWFHRKDPLTMIVVVH